MLQMPDEESTVSAHRHNQRLLGKVEHTRLTVTQVHYNKNCVRSTKFFENRQRKQMTSEDERTIYQLFHPFKIPYSVLPQNRHIAKCHIHRNV